MFIFFIVRRLFFRRSPVGDLSLFVFVNKSMLFFVKFIEQSILIQGLLYDYILYNISNKAFLGCIYFVQLKYVKTLYHCRAVYVVLMLTF